PAVRRHVMRTRRRERIELRVVFRRLDIPRVALRGVEKRVMTDRHQPWLDVRAGPEGVPSTQGLKKGFLHEIIGTRSVARERAREARDVAQVRQGEPLEFGWVGVAPA